MTELHSVSIRGAQRVNIGIHKLAVLQSDWTLQQVQTSNRLDTRPSCSVLMGVVMPDYTPLSPSPLSVELVELQQSRSPQRLQGLQINRVVTPPTPRQLILL